MNSKGRVIAAALAALLAGAVSSVCLAFLLFFALLAMPLPDSDWAGLLLIGLIVAVFVCVFTVVFREMLEKLKAERGEKFTR